MGQGGEARGGGGGGGGGRSFYSERGDRSVYLGKLIDWEERW